ncbi:FAD-dependent oxidoreductase [Lignipirellula cremea]|uniref:FAD-dependent urate hydroxylase n=1 Tax=Lignipirellula cremea TaxID=2528010 RepID=A0A518DSU4_9BACT|nr:FAD-dependent monooxygenase [Lignipirellula cremea]QDU94910.1 FAD-dependent urate hydroxylase [Lignipirellula cremea]
MRILIVGAGIGGMTLAALLRQRGQQATLVERAPDFEHAGYMLGLWPLGSRVLHGLSLYERFAADSMECTDYEVRDNHGELVKHWSMGPISDRFGPNLSCTRPQLIHLLHQSLGDADLRFSTSLASLQQQGEEVTATFSTGEQETFDLVVGADGLHSCVRQMVFGDQPYYHTGWGGWVWYADLASAPAGTFIEHWGTGRFVGGYPTRDGVGIFAGAPTGDEREKPGPGRRQRIREQFAGMGQLVDAWLDDLPDDNASMFYWKLSDVRSAEWTRGRVVLLGDAAAGFLPTAGIGASMAMESAAVLADELARTDIRFVEHALALYVKRRKHRVESIQDDSRHLARTMFLKSSTLSHIRNLATKFYSLEQLAGSIAKAFDQPI